MISIKPGFIIESEIDGQEVLKQIEKVGRTCYKSEDRITDESAHKFVASLIKHGHEAVIEHNSITVRFICDRGVSHEIVRHRLASFAQESTRYCNYNNDKFGKEINVISIEDGIKLDTKMKELTPEIINEILDEWTKAMEDAERHYMKMIELGATAQIARAVLPNSLKTEIVVTMNLREWRHFFKLRTELAAHPQMREITIPLLKEMKTLIPVIFDDIE
ncbi:FAD-dependent thymidylate synthase [Clostridium sp. 19966]|uniref:FAD-dependent thymidylate synthase n=1 Tax=Clostridium sp. 19966 TaxID=2768166 RepID=UPI0028DED8A8|nr:FAD-dependent thymidylate synthase [Clostridium sp. 19966]MDT8719389.1 FAD-dependent thymidylate synthase [Clostridium sp. 19966]